VTVKLRAGWKVIAAAIAFALVLSGCAHGAPDGPDRIVAFGDVHGDLQATRRALRLAGAIDEDDRWIGGELVVVQTGDQLDRGGDEQEILDLFVGLQAEASAAGGAFHALLGNHELMNAQGDLRYVTEAGFQDFEDAVEGDLDDPDLAEFEPEQRARVAALRPGGRYALVLAERRVVLQLGSNVFVHGGVLPHHVAHGIDALNDRTKGWLRGETAFPAMLDGPDSPQWTRLFSRQPDEEACEVLRDVLGSLDAERMVMGHTPHDGIQSACDGAAWLIDVGMASHYGGPIEVLEIRGDSLRVLRAGGDGGI
jgi:hypothetical protein